MALSSEPWHFRENFQHTAINIDGNGINAVALGGGVGHRLKIAAAALGSGGSRRTCNDCTGIDTSVDIVKSNCLILWRWHQRWQGWQERSAQCKGGMLKAMARRQAFCIGGGCDGGADAKMMLARQGQGDDDMAPDQHRQGKGNTMMDFQKR
jgi:hypothetical protein